MTINAILGNAVSALSANQTALRTISQNVANANNPDYVRREVMLESLNAGGFDGGVGIGEIRRMAADFLNREIQVSRSDSSLFDAMARVHDRIQGLFGAPDSPNSLPQRVNSALAYAAELTVDPVSAPRRLGYVSELNETLRYISTLSTQVLGVRGEVDQSVDLQVEEANALIKQIHELNAEIQRAEVRGDDETVIWDQRDTAIRKLASMMGIRTNEQSNGAIHVTTTDGFALVTESRIELDYQSTGYTGADVSFAPIIAHRINSSTGLREGTPRPFDEHIESGSLRGLLSMRDEKLPALAAELGALAAGFADAINAVHNDAIAVPPPNTLSGRNTGLLGTDALGFTGATTLAIVDQGGALVSRIDVDFSAGTLSVNGGASVAIGTTISSFIGALDTALGANGDATFANGVLTIDAANAAHGVGLLEADPAGSSRGGRSLGQFFGLNDLITGKRPSHFATGLAGGDTHGFTGGGTIDFAVRGPNGELATEFTFTMPGGGDINSVLAALNNPGTGLGTYMSFSLGADGRLAVTPAAGYDGYRLDVVGDGTQRAGSGVTFTELFGIGRRFQMEQAQGLGVPAAIIGDPNRLALAKLDIDGATVVGDIVATESDSRGAEALLAAGTAPIAFGAAGALDAAITSIGDYATLVVARSSSDATATDRLAEAAKTIESEVEYRRSAVEGVNLDEELANMIIFQQAYNASARLVTVAREIYDQLINIV